MIRRRTSLLVIIACLVAPLLVFGVAGLLLFGGVTIVEREIFGTLVFLAIAGVLYLMFND